MEAAVIRSTIHDIYPVEFQTGGLINTSPVNNAVQPPNAIGDAGLSSTNIPESSGQLPANDPGIVSGWTGWPGFFKMILVLGTFCLVYSGYVYYAKKKKEKEANGSGKIDYLE